MGSGKERKHSGKDAIMNNNQDSELWEVERKGNTVERML